MSAFRTFSSVALRARAAWREPAIRFGFATIVVVWASVAVQVSRQLSDNESQAVRDTNNIARTFEESVRRGLKQIEFNLELIRRRATRVDEAQWGDLLQEVISDNETTVQMSLIRRTGMMVASTLDPHPTKPLNLSDREHFRVHVDSDGDAPFVSRPVVGRVSKKWTIQISRGIRSASNEFMGVAVVSLDPRYFVRFYEQLVLGSRSAIALVGADGIIRAAAGAAYGMLGQSVDGMPLGAAMHGSGEGYIKAVQWDGSEKHTTWRRIPDLPLFVVVSSDVEQAQADGTAIRRFLLLAAALVSLAIAATALRIARTHRAEQKTRRRLEISERRASIDRQRLRITLDSVKQGIVMADVHGRIVVRSKAAERLVGGAADGGRIDVDRRLHGLVVRSACGHAHGKATRDVDCSKCTTCPQPLRPTSATEVLENGKVIELMTVPLEGGGFVATLEDVTEKKRQHDDLIEAKATADAANRAKSAFLANMSHEIRTPMNGVIGLADVLLSTELDAEQRKCAEAIAASGASLLDIINDMLDFSKIEAGKMAIERKPFDLLVLIEDVTAVLSALAVPKGLEIALIYDSELPRTWVGDPLRIRQIVTNLLGNAIKFTPSGHVVVEARQRQSSDGTREVAIAVRDTGIGIDVSRVGLIFEEFVQLGATNRQSFGGTGLGLAISRRLAGLMGGRIDVASAVGFGSTFTLQLPLEAAPATSSTDDTIVVEGKRALIVDDLPEASRGLACWLSKWGFAVVRVEDADAALAAVSTQSFDLVLVDVDIADDGTARLAERLGVNGRGEPRCRVVPLLPAGRRPDEVNWARFAATLAKPVRMAALRDVVRPLATAARVVELVPAAAGGTDGATVELQRRIKILAAEDGPTNRLVLASMLRREPVDLVFAHDGNEAVAAFERELPDLVLMDVWMPELDGFEATARIRAAEVARGCRRTPIIALTANAVRGDREKCIEAGMDDYMSKPILKRDLMRMLARWGDADPHGPDTREPWWKERRRRTNDAAGVAGRWESEQPFIDEDHVAAQLADFGAESFADMVAQFVHDVDNALGDVMAAAGRGDTKEIRALVLLVRGCAAHLGVTGIVRLCDRVRSEIDGGEVDWHQSLSELLDGSIAAKSALLLRAAEMAGPSARPRSAVG